MKVRTNYFKSVPEQIKSALHGLNLVTLRECKCSKQRTIDTLSYSNGTNIVCDGRIKAAIDILRKNLIQNSVVNR